MKIQPFSSLAEACTSVCGLLSANKVNHCTSVGKHTVRLYRVETGENGLCLTCLKKEVIEVIEVIMCGMV